MNYYLGAKYKAIRSTNISYSFIYFSTGIEIGFTFLAEADCASVYDIRVQINNVFLFEVSATVANAYELQAVISNNFDFVASASVNENLTVSPKIIEADFNFTVSTYVNNYLMTGSLIIIPFTILSTFTACNGALINVQQVEELSFSITIGSFELIEISSAIDCDFLLVAEHGIFNAVTVEEAKVVNTCDFLLEAQLINPTVLGQAEISQNLSMSANLTLYIYAALSVYYEKTVSEINEKKLKELYLVAA